MKKRMRFALLGAAAVVAPGVVPATAPAASQQAAKRTVVPVHYDDRGA